jgi:phosphopantothenoylcysteine decarboxylase/phosphopantothenate--cysteine ligase
MARLLLGVTGGVAAYKAIETTRLAVRAGHAVRVIQTPTSERFVGRASFEAITGAPVLLSEFEHDPARGSYPGEPLPERAPISHLALVEAADVYLIAPASANTIAKLAHGHADNLVTAAALAAACPLAVAPAMNARMYLNPATTENLEVLAGRGVTVIGPEFGELASHAEQGIGRLAEPPALVAACERLLGPQSLAGKRVLVTAGGTREPIDSVRYIGNRSSGRMGLALAASAARCGADVTVIAANVGLSPPPGVRVLSVETAAELAERCAAEFPDADVLLMAAAVADFRPAEPVADKLDKRLGTPIVTLEPTEDVLATLAPHRRRNQLVIGFAAEHGFGGLEHAAAKLERKQLDAIVVNDVSQAGIGFEAEENEVVILSADHHRVEVRRDRKDVVAGAVIDEVVRLLARGGTADGAVETAAGSPAGV